MTAQPVKNRYALLVGGSTNLPMSEMELLIAADELKKRGFKIIAATSVLPEEADHYYAPTPEGITKLFKKLQSSMKPGSEIVLAADLHGLNERGERNRKLKKVANKPLVDDIKRTGKDIDGSSKLSVKGGTIPEDVLRRLIQKLPAGKKTLVIDVCFSGNLQKSLSGPNSLFIASGQKDEVVYDSEFSIWSAIQHLKDTDGDGHLNFSEIVDYFKTKTKMQSTPIYRAGPGYNDTGLDPDKPRAAKKSNSKNVAKDAGSIPSQLRKPSTAFFTDLFKRTKSEKHRWLILAHAEKRWHKNDSNYVANAASAAGNAYFNLYAEDDKSLEKLDPSILAIAGKISDDSDNKIRAGWSLIKRDKWDEALRVLTFVSSCEGVLKKLIAEKKWDLVLRFLEKVIIHFNKKTHNALAKLLLFLRKEDGNVPNNVILKAISITNNGDLIEQGAKLLCQRNAWADIKKTVDYISKNLEGNDRDPALMKILNKAKDSPQIGNDIIRTACIISKLQDTSLKGLQLLLDRKEYDETIVVLKYAKKEWDVDTCYLLADSVIKQFSKNSAIPSPLLSQAALLLHHTEKICQIISTLLKRKALKELSTVIDYSKSELSVEQHQTISDFIEKHPNYNSKNKKHKKILAKIRPVIQIKIHKVKHALEQGNAKKLNDWVEKAEEDYNDATKHALAKAIIAHAESQIASANKKTKQRFIPTEIARRACFLSRTRGLLKRGFNLLLERKAIKDCQKIITDRYWNKSARTDLIDIVINTAASDTNFHSGLIRDACIESPKIFSLERGFELLMERSLFDEAKKVLEYAKDGFNKNGRHALARKVRRFIRLGRIIPAALIERAIKIDPCSETIDDGITELLSKGSFERIKEIMEWARNYLDKNRREEIAKLVIEEGNVVPASVTRTAMTIANYISTAQEGLETLLDKGAFAEVEKFIDFSRANFNPKANKTYTDLLLKYAESNELPASLIKKVVTGK